jgi:hypothetical protein
MASNYPIWHQVQACHYKTSKSWGGKNDSGETIYVGTSASYSYEHCKILTTRRVIVHPKLGECYIFKTSVDGVVLKETLIRIKDKQMVKQRTKLKRIKSL